VPVTRGTRYPWSSSIVKSVETRGQRCKTQVGETSNRKTSVNCVTGAPSIGRRAGAARVRPGGRISIGCAESAVGDQSPSIGATEEAPEDLLQFRHNSPTRQRLIGPPTANANAKPPQTVDFHMAFFTGMRSVEC
jgi:hypothetical protein